jgi:GcrA cell cycle regulator
MQRGIRGLEAVMGMGWTEERVALLTRWWREGLSCALIAAQLGGTSRHAVIGKINRLGLPKRLTRVHVPYRPRAVIGRPVTVAFERGATPQPRGVEPNSAPVTLLEVTGCRWPASDPFAPPGSVDLFCNCAVVPGKSWCAEHLARGLRKTTPATPIATKAAQTSVGDESEKLAA